MTANTAATRIIGTAPAFKSFGGFPAPFPTAIGAVGSVDDSEMIFGIVGLDGRMMPTEADAGFWPRITVPDTVVNDGV